METIQEMLELCEQEHNYWSNAASLAAANRFPRPNTFNAADIAYFERRRDLYAELISHLQGLL